MCGRITQFSAIQEYAELFGITSSLLSAPRYNVAPSSQITACRLSTHGDRELVSLHWGLIPSWSKGSDKRYSMINARAETVAEKPAYRGPFRKRRCLIPVDGFYEWKQDNGKQPYYIHACTNKPLVLAGIWDIWQDNTDNHIESCSIIVCPANEQMQSIHDRMPVILPSALWDRWLSGQDPGELKSMLTPSAEVLDIHPVSRAVNNPRNDNPDLINKFEPVAQTHNS